MLRSRENAIAFCKVDKESTPRVHFNSGEGSKMFFEEKQFVLFSFHQKGKTFEALPRFISLLFFEHRKSFPFSEKTLFYPDFSFSEEASFGVLLQFYFLKGKPIFRVFENQRKLVLHFCNFLKVSFWFLKMKAFLFFFFSEEKKQKFFKTFENDIFF